MEAMTQSGNAAGEEDLVASEYLTFTLGGEEYAIDILKVQEIRGYEPPTLIANAPAFIKGVINLRGTIVPIVDLRAHFAERDRWFRGIVTDAVMLHGYGLMLP